MHCNWFVIKMSNWMASNAQRVHAAYMDQLFGRKIFENQLVLFIKIYKILEHLKLKSLSSSLNNQFYPSCNQ